MKVKHGPAAATSCTCSWEICAGQSYSAKRAIEDIPNQEPRTQAIMLACNRHSTWLLHCKLVLVFISLTLRHMLQLSDCGHFPSTCCPQVAVAALPQQHQQSQPLQHKQQHQQQHHQPSTLSKQSLYQLPAPGQQTPKLPRFLPQQGRKPLPALTALQIVKVGCFGDHDSLQ